MHLATAVQLQQGKVTAVRVLLRIIIIIIVLYSEDDIRIYVELAAEVYQKSWTPKQKS